MPAKSTHHRQLCLFAPDAEIGLATLEALDARDDAPTVASLRIGSISESGSARAREIISQIQRSETAVLINDDWQTAQAVHADGIHLSRADDVVARLTRAQQHLGKDMIIGVAGGMSRHEAMELGEAGASYLAWALTADSQDANEETEAERGAEMIRWWSSVFEVPAVAMFGLETTADVDIGASEFVEFTCSGDGAADCRAKADAIAAAFAKVSETALEPAS